MNIRVLRYFIEIVREGNISSAAHRLHISQPALSRQIMELETTLGVTLFERGHRQIKLTQEGYYLYERAQEITALVDKTTYHLQSNSVVSGTLDIGAGESSALMPLMDVLAQILRYYEWGFNGDPPAGWPGEPRVWRGDGPRKPAEL